MNSNPSEQTKTERPVLDEGRQKKAREYSRARRRLGFGETGLLLALLLILIFSQASSEFAGLFPWPRWAAAVIYFLVLVVAFEIITFPLSYYRGFVLPHRYGISTQNFKSWLADQGKGGALGLVFGAAAVAAGYWLLLTFPVFWWLLAWALVLVVSILMTIIAPVFIVPLFYKVKPLADPDLKSRLEQLVKKARAEVRGIYMLDFSSKMTAANAALMGIGRTRRIVISDTLAQQYPVPEIEVVTAHEIGHHMNQDIYRLFVVQSAVYLAGFKIIDIVLKAVVTPLGFDGISDPAALPLLILIFAIFGTLVSPLMNTCTRYVERQADGYALRLTDDPQAFIDAMTRLTNQNLSVGYPSSWEELFLYDHPSYKKRLEHALAYARKSSGKNNSGLPPRDRLE